MATKADSGGAAFPHNEPWTGPGMGNDIQHSGMSMRDYFAGQALSGLCANSALVNAIADQSGPASVAPNLSKAAFRAADAMLAERAKGGA